MVTVNDVDQLRKNLASVFATLKNNGFDLKLWTTHSDYALSFLNHHGNWVMIHYTPNAEEMRALIVGMQFGVCEALRNKAENEAIINDK